MAKVLANKLKSIMDNVVSSPQFAFVPVRLIIDNVIVAFEIIHHMKRKTRRQKGRLL